MTIEEAIKHCEEKAQGCDACSEEHKELAMWLKELLDRRKSAAKPVVRNGNGKMIKDCSLLDWADALDEERVEVVDAAVRWRQDPSWNNRKHLLEELADIQTVCTSWQNAIGADADERAEIQREVNEKNRRRGYFE